MLERSRLGEGSLRPQKGDTQWIFQCQAGRHDFPEQASHILITQRPLISGFNQAQHLSLTLGTIEYRVAPCFLLDIGNLARCLGTGIEQILYLRIDAVDALTDNA